jgi:CheY-like chemotaxis protein
MGTGFSTPGILDASELSSNTKARKLLKAVIDETCSGETSSLFCDEGIANVAAQLLSSDTYARQAVVAFMIYEKTDHNLIFFEAIEHLETSKSFNSDIAGILIDFIQPGSDMMIDISSELRDNIVMANAERMPEVEQLKLLRTAQWETLQTIMKIIVRFRKSKYYDQWCQLESTASAGDDLPAPKNEYLSILMVEDSMPVIKIMTRSFFDKGYTVEVAMDGKDAMQKILSKRYFAALVDFNIPLLSGPEVVTKFREHEVLQMKSNGLLKRLPIIGMSASTGKAVMRLGADAGMDGFLRKPFKVDRFLELVERLNLIHSVTHHRKGRRASIEQATL